MILSHLEVLLQTPQQFPVHVSGLGHAEALLLGLTEPVLEDAAVFVGAVQFPAQILQLVNLLLQVVVPDLLHLGSQLVHFILENSYFYDIYVTCVFFVQYGFREAGTQIVSLKAVENEPQCFKCHCSCWILGLPINIC